MRFLAALLRSLVTLLVLLTPLYIDNQARAQDLDNVTIAGRVADEQGASLYGAQVTVKLLSKNLERRVTADADGRYRIIGLEPGEYSVKASFKNFADEERTNLSMVAGQSVTLDFVLRPAGIRAQQTVSADLDAPAVDTERTVVGGTVTREEAEQLPLASRAPYDLLFTLGGVTEEPLSTRGLAEERDAMTRATPEEAGNFSLSGGAPYSTQLIITKEIRA